MIHYTYMLRLVLTLVAFGAHAQEIPPFPPPPEDVSSKAILVTQHEPGERLRIHGTVYHADGTTVYKGLIIYLYQTDSAGVYNHETGSWREPRLQGWIKTDDRGGYAIHTIKPGSYPKSRNPAHIHAIVRLPGKSPDWIDDFLFVGDPFLSEQQLQKSQEKAPFAHIMELSRDTANVLTGVRDIRIED